MVDTACRWRLARNSDVDRLSAFVIPRESWAASFSAKVFGLLPGTAMTTLSMHRGFGPGLYVRCNDTGPVLGAVLFCRSGSVFPVLDDTNPTGSTLEELASMRASLVYRPGACIGPVDQVHRLEEAMRWNIALGISYYTMVRNASPVGLDLPYGYRVAKAGISDLESLMPVAIAYEREEVLTPIHRFNPIVCRASQERALKRQTVYAVWHGKNLVARAQTNAIGISCEQMGGVYVVPELRGKGLGRAVVAALVSDIAARGKACCLFVKQANSSAGNLYASMGFRTECEYRVDYLG